jgi:predicted nicotinamide N-methyase
MSADPPRNWRVNWVRSPSGISTDVSRQVVLEVVTDFGERVGSESFDGESVSVDLANLGISLSLHPDIVPPASLFDDVWSRGQETAQDAGGGGGGGVAGIALEAFADMECSRALDAERLAVGRDGCARAWIRAGAPTRRGCSHLRIRARCTYNRAPVHAGGGMILSAWSPTCVLMGEGDAKQPAMAGEEALQARSLTFGSLKGHHRPLPLWLYENVRTRSTGGNLWDVAMIVGEVVAACYDIGRVREEGGEVGEEPSLDAESLEGGWKLLLGDPKRQVGLAGGAFKHGGRVAELGAGTGAVGLLCGMAGAGEVVLTDNDEEVLSLLRMNAAANLGKKGCKGKAPPPHRACTSSSPSPSSSWQVKKLVWGEEPSSQGASVDDGKGEGGAGLGHFDLIVASECVYAEVGFYPLCRTLLSLSSETSRIILGFRSRDSKAEALVKELLGQHFIISSVSVERAPRHLPRFCEQGGVEIYALRRRLECDVPRPPALSALARYLVEQGNSTSRGSGAQ